MPEQHTGNEKTQQQTESIRIYEGFADSEQYNNAIDTNIWSNTDSDGNHTSVVVSASSRMEQDGGTTAGSTYFRTNRLFSRNVVIEADLITTTLTEGASAGEVFPSIRLYTSATEWVRWGPYRENGGQNSIGFIQFSDKGDVNQEVDVNATNTDAVKRNYKIMVLEDKLLFYLDNVYQFEMSMVGLHDFYVDLITSTTQADNAYADIFWSEVRVENIEKASLDIVERSIVEILHSKPQGDIFYVNSALGDDSNFGTWDSPRATIDGGVNACAANHGDVVVVINAGATYDENAAVTGVTMDTAGVTLLGLNRPTVENTNGAAAQVMMITAGNCTVIGFDIQEGTAGVNGIEIDSADYNVIHDNIIWGDMDNGIELVDSDWNWITDNHVAEMGTGGDTGILITGSSRSNRVKGNFIDNSDVGISVVGTGTQNLLWNNALGGSGGGMATGVNVGAGVNHTQIVGNHFNDITDDIADAGASTDISGNHKNYTAFNNTAIETNDGQWQILAGLFAADGANVFNPTVDGAARTDLEQVFNALDGMISGKTDSGACQVVTTTIDLNQAAAPYTLWTGTGQDVILESLVIKMANLAAGGALTSIEIETDDTTNQTIISAVTGAVANLTAENQLAWGAMENPLIITVGKVIRLNIAGGAHGVAYECTVVAKYRSVVDGGTLA